MLNLIPVTIKTYQALHVSSPEYKAIRERCTELGREHFEVWHSNPKGTLSDGVYHVETAHLFANQSNTAEGHRIFDWYDGMHSGSRSYRTGHYIEACEGFDQLQALRASVQQCGNCGAQYEHQSDGWCHKCVGSEHLKPGDYHLLQLLPVSQSFNGIRDKVIPDSIVAEIKTAQAATATQINEKKIASRITKLETEITDAKLELAFVTECIANGMVASDLDNLIYYSHTNRFCFGWRNPLSNDDRLRIQSQLGDLASRHDVDFK